MGVLLPGGVGGNLWLWPRARDPRCEMRVDCYGRSDMADPCFSLPAELVQLLSS